MQTRLAAFIEHTREGADAGAILRTCVHCGLCLATCPTYQLLGDELDGPRGRIYLIKQMLEGEPASAATLRHLDRCLNCRACETTCPSGVRYGRLLDIGQQVAAQRIGRSVMDRLRRRVLAFVFRSAARFSVVLGLGRALRPLLPKQLQTHIPPQRAAGHWPPPRHDRWMVTPGGCVQPALAPSIDTAAAQVLDKLGISLLAPPVNVCCGALDHHLGADNTARNRMRKNVDAWWSQLEAGAEAIVLTSSACALQAKEYGELLADDACYAGKAARVSAAVRDLAEIVAAEDLSALGNPGSSRSIAFHPPCTLQHGQRLGGVAEMLLTRVGFELVPVADAHLCCGSAGTYSLLQPAIAARLRANKLAALSAAAPELIASANIGCLAHLGASTELPVVHWIELLVGQD